ncbi:MAG: hypothetical protein GXP41_03215 [Chloroflexi bacterium]|nr:hypothetical protein [Chloroflexota bacterium]
MATYPVDQDVVLQHFLRKVTHVAGMNLKAVVLYGPRVVAKNGKPSEYNILTILDKDSPAICDQIAGVATHMRADHQVSFSVVALTEEEQRKKIHNPQWRQMREKGVVVWPRRMSEES